MKTKVTVGEGGGSSVERRGLWLLCDVGEASGAPTQKKVPVSSSDLITVPTGLCQS